MPEDYKVKGDLNDTQINLDIPTNLKQRKFYRLYLETIRNNLKLSDGENILLTWVEIASLSGEIADN